MPKIFSAKDYAQGSERWLELRLGIPTASEFGRFMDKDFNLKLGKAKGSISQDLMTYVYEKLAERYTGAPLPAFNSWATDQGHLRESHARKWYELTYDCDIEPVAFIKTDDGKAGCSPDGLIRLEEGIEIKCPEAVNQIRYALAGKLPGDYLHQVHGSIFVAGAKRWHFLSYRQDFPHLVLTVERDEEIMSRIAATIDAFSKILDAEFAILKDLP